jgi:hypothetical protein
MDTNRHEAFRGEAALECGGLTPLSQARPLIVDARVLPKFHPAVDRATLGCGFQT